MQSSKMKVALGIVRNKKGKVLIVERKNKEMGENGARLEWAFPGGKVEEGETEVLAAEREVYEETGICVKTEKLICTRHHPEFPVELFYFSCDIIESPVGKIQDSNILQARWIEPSEIETYFTSDIHPVVKSFLKVH